MQQDLTDYTSKLETLTTTLNDNAKALNDNVKDPEPTPSPEPPAPSPVPSPSIEDITPGSGSASVEEPGEEPGGDYAGGSGY
ncbi:hypothetical protein QP355_07050, partial [Gardnerella vaginalis]